MLSSVKVFEGDNTFIGKIKGKKVKIIEKGLGTPEKTHEGIVVSYLIGDYIELDTGSLINGKYISKVDIIE